MFNPDEIPQAVPNKVGFYASKFQGNHFPGANPSLKIFGTNITAVDSFGDNVQDGDVASDLTDTNRVTRIHVDMSADTSETFYFIAPTGDQMDVDWMIMDGNSLRDAFGAPLERVFEVWTNDDDSPFLVNSDVITPSRVRASIIGKTEPSLSFDGDDDVVTIADDPNFALGTEFTFAIWLKRGATGIRQGIFGSLNGNWACQFNADDTIRFSVLGGTDVDTTATVTDSDWHNLVIVYSGTQVTIYLDGVEVKPATTATTITTTSGSESFIGSAQDGVSHNYNGDMREVTLYNRALAPKELESMALGVPVPKPLIIGNNSSMNTVGDWNNASTAAILTGGYDSGDSGHEDTLRIEASDANFELAKLDGVFTLIAGHRYRLEIPFKPVNTDNRTVADRFIRLGGPSIRELVLTSTANLTTGTWLNIDETFTADAAYTELTVYANANNGDAANEYLLDNVYLTDLDTAVTFPLVVDQWGNQTQLVTNGDAFTGATGSTPPNSWTDSGAGTAAYLIRNNTPVANMDADTLEFSTTGGEKTLKQSILTSGEYYKLTFAYRSVDGSSPSSVYMGTSANKINLQNTTFIGDGILFSHIFLADGTNMSFVVSDGGAVQIDNVQVVRSGAVASYQPTGLNTNDDGGGNVLSWYDSSDNALTGTVTGAKGINVANESGSSPSTDMLLYQFNLDFNPRYWFFTVNKTAGFTVQVDDVFFGQLSFGKRFVPEVNPDINFGISSEWGIAGSTTRSGSRLTNKLHDVRQNWVLNWSNISADLLAEFQTLWATVEVSDSFSNYPLYFSPNEEDPNQVFHFVRIIGVPEVTAIYHGRFAVTMELSSETEYNLD